MSSLDHNRDKYSERTTPPEQILNAAATIEKIAIPSTVSTVSAFSLPRIASAWRGEAGPPPETSRPDAYHQQMATVQSSQMRDFQLRELVARLGQLTDDWPRPAAAIEGRCWLGSEGETELGCESNELKEVFAGHEYDIASVLHILRSLGAPSMGISITYRNGQYSVSPVDKAANEGPI